ncbi:MAG: hypothetical protein IKQ48_02850 [Paludibacteraceae bacterium]|nr:hypothetical protein [Paludibacteraceae bacterium]
MEKTHSEIVLSKSTKAHWMRPKESGQHGVQQPKESGRHSVQQPKECGQHSVQQPKESGKTANKPKEYYKPPNTK